MLQVALVTATVAAGLDPDLEPLAGALERAGATPLVVAWDDPEVDWSEFACAVLRSAWDYPERHDEFLAWVESTARSTLLLNHPDIIRWSSDKHYLADLSDALIPVVATSFADPGEEIMWPDSPQLVVKPALSAGSRSTGRFTDRSQAHHLVEAIWASGRTAMIQPYLTGVDESGERGLVYFGGSFSHAFRKGPMLSLGAAPTPDLFAPEQIDPAAADIAEQEVAEAALDLAREATGQEPLYGRVDLASTPEGPVVLELELVEPSVYHSTAPESADRFARAILGRAIRDTRFAIRDTP